MRPRIGDTSGSVSQPQSRLVPVVGEPRRKAGFVEHEAASGPPRDVVLTLEEALDLLAALEDARDILVGTDHLSVLAQVEDQIQRVSRKLGFDQGGSDAN